MIVQMVGAIHDRIAEAVGADYVTVPTDCGKIGCALFRVVSVTWRATRAKRFYAAGYVPRIWTSAMVSGWGSRIDLNPSGPG